jgi:hypothetical protein
VATSVIAGGALRESLQDHDLMTRLGPGAGMFPTIVTSAALFLMVLFGLLVLLGLSLIWPQVTAARRRRSRPKTGIIATAQRSTTREDS